MYTYIKTFPLNQRMVERKREMVLFQTILEKRRIRGDREQGRWWATRLPGLWVPEDVKRKSYIKYAAVQIRMPGGGGGSPRAKAASLSLFSVANLFWHFPRLQSDIYSWPFLCCLTSFTLPFLASHSPRSYWEPVSFWLAASVISPLCHSPTSPYTATNAFKSLY